MSDVIKSFKGFDKDLKCRGFQYEIGKEYEQSGEIIVCSKGFHACEVPMDVLSHYGTIDSRYCEVEQSGTLRRERESSKVASSQIKIGAEIGLPGLVKAQIEWVKKTCEDAPESMSKLYRGHAAAQGDSGHAAAQGDFGHAAAQGDSGHAAAQGDRGHAAAQGYRGHAAAQGVSGHAAAQGDFGHAEVKGRDAIAAAFGIEGMAKAAIGSWIMCTEWVYTDKWQIKEVKTAKIDGEILKPDTWYTLKDGEFKEVKE